MSAHFPPSRACVAMESERRAGSVVSRNVTSLTYFLFSLFYITMMGAQHRTGHLMLPENTW